MVEVAARIVSLLRTTGWYTTSGGGVGDMVTEMATAEEMRTPTTDAVMGLRVKLTAADTDGPLMIAGAVQTIGAAEVAAVMMSQCRCMAVAAGSASAEVRH